MSAPSTSLRIAVCMTSPPDSYSGGRYAAVGLAEAIALCGHESWLIANHRPRCLDDFTAAPAHERVHFQRSRDFRRDIPPGDFDVVILVPSTGVPAFGERVTAFALERNARLVLYNFETPNWCNALSSAARDARDWNPWRRSAAHASSVLSISGESSGWAREFYADVAPDAKFHHFYPPINTPVADAAPAVPRERRIVVFMRFSSAEHKGSGKLLELLDESMRGFSLVLVMGKEEVPEATRSAMEKRAESLDISLEYRRRISDREKFEELKRARLLLFPSEFEGYGYPPVEALYCGTPCVAFDLPVLRETCGDALCYAPPGDWPAFRREIAAALGSNFNPPSAEAALRPITRLDRASDALDTYLRSVMVQRIEPSAARSHIAARLRLKDKLGLLDTRTRVRFFFRRWSLRIRKRLPV